eukprot:GFUD01018946.1.p1 GENE.GFUD01018946.1~~GFUD01018946.1.p1  ORF type:complete len:484 (-),score=72.73 GFUD01018946.1:65-1516(-)
MATGIKTLKSPVDIQNLFFDLLEENVEDSSIYQDTKLACRDGTIFSNKLILSLAFPLLEKHLAWVGEIMEPVIILPDYSTGDVRLMIETFLTEAGVTAGFYEKREVLDDSDMQDALNVNNWHYDDSIAKDEADIKSEVDCESLDQDNPLPFFHNPLIKTKRLPCLTCVKATFKSTAERKIHMKTCQVLFKCNFCYETFLTDLEKQDHEQSYINSEGQLKCRFETCDIAFKERRCLVRHIKQVHDAGQDTAYSCYFCGEHFIGKAPYRKHMKMYKNGPKDYKCPEDGCDSRFRVKRTLLDHLRKHRGVYEYSCETCGKIFTTKYTKTSHMRTHESPQQQLICQICSKSFRNKLRLNGHMNTTHADNKDEVKYQCDQCEKGFTNMQKFKRHLHAHTGVRNFGCSTCGKKFMDKVTLDNHEKAHAGIKPHKCSVCGKGFLSSNKLKRHEVVHTGVMDFNCSRCGKQFNQKINKNTHEKKCKGVYDI